jgi:hypothetical protein
MSYGLVEVIISSPPKWSAKFLFSSPQVTERAG